MSELQPSRLCDKCNVEMVIREHAPDWKPPSGKKYFYKKWFTCPTCYSIHPIQSTKVLLPVDLTDKFLG